MIDPSLPLQKAIFAALSADTAMRALIGNPARVYDRVPEKPTFPYVTVSDADVVDDSDGCHAGAETVASVHVWSRAVGKVEAKQIAARAALVLDAEIAIDGHAVIIHEILRTAHMSDPDGLTSHSVVVVRYVTAPTS